MRNDRKSKLLTIVCIYLILIGIIVAAYFAHNDAAFNHYKTITPAIHVEYYLGDFFGAGWLTVGIGCLFALIWAFRLQNQIRHARWFRNSVIVLGIFSLLGVYVSVNMSRMDCGNTCMWSIFPKEIEYIIGIFSTLLYFGISMRIYKFMIRNSTLK